MSKKRVAWKLALVSTIVAFMLILFIIIEKPYLSPLEEYDFSNCRVGVCDYLGVNVFSYLKDDERDLLLEQLYHTEPYGEGGIQHQNYVGLPAQYRFELNDGSVITIYVCDEYLVIDNLSYKCKDEKALIEFDKFNDDILHQEYAINKES